jgi:hypothetical protein
MSNTVSTRQLGNRIADGFSWVDQMEAMYKGADSLFSKATFQSDDIGRSNRAYGEVLWQQANTATPLYGMLPKMTGDAPNNINNPRPMTFRAVFNPPSMTTPGEAGSWGTPVDFDTREVDLDPRHSTMRFESSLLQQVFADIQDNVPFENITQVGEEYFQRELEVSGIARAVNGTSVSTAADTPQYSSDTAIAPLDRVIASEDEEANATDVAGDAFADGDLDIYNIDRTDTGNGGDNEANWADAVVNHNSGGGDRQLTRDVIDSTIESLEQNGTTVDNLVMFTGYDTARVVSELVESQFRGDAMIEAVTEAVSRGADDAETRSGRNFGNRLSHYEGIPIVAGPNVPSDSLSRIFLLDMTTMQDPVTGENIPKLGIENYIPMTVETGGLGQETNTLAFDSLVEQYGVLMTHEIRCNRFNHQAKIRDLQE